jgi:hypothetical protein
MGLQLLDHEPDLLSHRFLLVKNLIVPEPENTKTSCLQFLCAIFVILCLLPMLAPIYFNDQFVFQADKIEDVITKWMLTAKLKLPAQKAGASGEVSSFILCPFIPPTRRGFGTRSGQTADLTTTQKMPQSLFRIRQVVA